MSREYELHNATYMMDLGPGVDYWRIVGDCPDHPGSGESGVIMPSTPVSYDETKHEFKTVSGSTYKIMSFVGDPEKFTTQIHKDILNGGYERH